MWNHPRELLDASPLRATFQADNQALQKREAIRDNERVAARLVKGASGI